MTGHRLYIMTKASACANIV